MRRLPNSREAPKDGLQSGAAHRLANEKNMDTITPEALPQKAFTDPHAAWAYVSEIYHRNTCLLYTSDAADE